MLRPGLEEVSAVAILGLSELAPLIVSSDGGICLQMPPSLNLGHLVRLHEVVFYVLLTQPLGEIPMAGRARRSHSPTSLPNQPAIQ